MCVRMHTREPKDRRSLNNSADSWIHTHAAGASTPPISSVRWAVTSAQWVLVQWCVHRALGEGLVRGALCRTAAAETESARAQDDRVHSPWRCRRDNVRRVRVNFVASSVLAPPPQWPLENSTNVPSRASIYNLQRVYFLRIFRGFFFSFSRKFKYMRE